MRHRLAGVALTVPALTFLGCAGEPATRSVPSSGPAEVQIYQYSDPKAWRTTADGTLELFGASDYAPPYRSPRNIALIDGAECGDFVLELEAQQTGVETDHRDLCFFFGVESASRYYYVHIAKRADPNAHNIFSVADAPRTNIATATSAGIDWGRGVWRRIKIERELESGSIRVFFEDMVTPIMIASDTTHGRGLIGVGSFDDTGRFRNITVRSPDRGTTAKRVFPTAKLHPGKTK